MVEIVHTTRRVVSAEERKGAADRQAQQRAKLGLPLAFGAGEDAAAGAEVEAAQQGRERGWEEMYDDVTGAAYWRHRRTGRATWDPPPPEATPTEGRDDLKRYHERRYELFRRFDEGVRLDDEAWFSVTPELLAKHQAKRLLQAVAKTHSMVAVDVYAGAGGNAIQLAHRGGANAHVLGLELDTKRAHDAAHNAHVYGARWRVDIVIADATVLLPRLRAGIVDAVFSSPPWGGPRYRREQDGSFDADTLAPLSLADLWIAARRLLRDDDDGGGIAPQSTIATFLPRATTDASITHAAEMAGSDEVEVETAVLDRRAVGVTVYCRRAASPTSDVLY